MDSMLVLFILLGVGIFSLLGYKVFDELNTDLQADPDLNAQAKGTVSGLFDRYPAFIDGAFLLIFVLLWIFVLVSSSLIDSHPMFFVIALILMIFSLVVSVMLGNATEELLEDSEFSSITPQFPIMHWFLTHLLLVIIIICASILLALYGKNQFM